ncbi:MAG: hypothetical protein M3137_16875 [Actinomycetota bacterium]|nr:hypothetical protein [Actinomycetota bacterium]
MTEVLNRAASSRMALRWLGAHLDNHPGVLIEGPTSTVPVLDRFTRELAAAGARRVGVIHPACEGCGRRERPHGRRGQGWVCSACWARASLQPCHGCGNVRRVSARRDGEAWCPSCVRRQQGEAERDRLSDLIAATVVRADVGVDAAIVLRAVERVAPRLFRRRELAAMVDTATLQVSAHQPALLARLVADLRSQGALRLAAPLCEDCEAVAVETIVTGSHVRCGPCARRPAERSATSSRPARAERRRSRADRNESNRGTCGDCGGGRRLLDGSLRCRICRERAARFCDRCCGGAPLTRVGDERLCWTCALQVRVDALLPDVDDGPCGLLRHALLSAANPRTTALWLGRERVAGVLGSMGTARPGITHEGLDALGAGPGVGHLRDLLVAAGALDSAGRAVARLEAHAATAVAGLEDADRRIVAAWVRWRLLPRLRRREAAGASLANSAANARASLHEVVRLAGHVQGRGRSLRDCTQADLDAWLGRPGASRRTAVAFVAWATKKKHMPALSVPASPSSAPSVYADSEDRWLVARRLVRDDGIDIVDRVAGALVVLYAQPVSRIVGLRLVDVRYDDGQAIVTLAGHDLELPEPFATLVGQLPVLRRGGVVNRVENPWLFPGSRAGRHLAAANLANRLRGVGIEPRKMRGAALAQLSSEMAPAVLADVVGISPGAAVKWTTLHGGNWTRYAAGR